MYQKIRKLLFGFLLEASLCQSVSLRVNFSHNALNHRSRRQFAPFFHSQPSLYSNVLVDHALSFSNSQQTSGLSVSITTSFVSNTILRSGTEQQSSPSSTFFAYFLSQNLVHTCRQAEILQLWSPMAAICFNNLKIPSAKEACNLLTTFSAHISEWRFQPNLTPFSAWYWPIGVSIAYVCIILVLQRAMATRKSLEIPRVLFMHNITLCIASLFLGSWLTYTLASAFFGGLTTHELICSRNIYENGHLHAIYYINMFFKMWEFLDTFFLVLRKKPVAFLHAYHHAATLILTWNQLMEHSAPQWVPIVINLWVHVLMYYYYAMSALKIRVWWKKYLTKIQISQFVIDVTVIGYAYATFIRAGLDENVCYGTTTGALVGLGILFSYLLLFIRFYVQTYTKPRSKLTKKDN